MLRTTRLLPMVILLAGLTLLTVPTDARAAAPRAPMTYTDPPRWHSDYAVAFWAAKYANQDLMIFFHETGADSTRDKFESDCLADPQFQEQLDDYVLAKLPVDSKTTVDGEEITLLDHAAFAELQNLQGIAIIELSDPESPNSGDVVSIFPITKARSLNKADFEVVLHLPQGTLTQRTLIYAVRTHPEKPASSQGKYHALLASETEKHSLHQASILLQGHHNWESRFHRINGRLPGNLSAQEVCAESWPHQGLVEAAVECVHSWRQSSGHWGAVRRRHTLYGYDMKRGSNGVWYATGIFARP